MKLLLRPYIAPGLHMWIRAQKIPFIAVFIR